MGTNILKAFIRPSANLTLPLRHFYYSRLISQLVYQHRKMATAPLSQPREFPTSGFVVLDSSKDFEEETLPGYLKERYYPVHIGEVFRSRYQVMTKLGFGSSSTVWLCQDLHDGQFLVLKVHVHTVRQPSEVQISNHLKMAHNARGVERYIRLVLDSFEVSGPYGTHSCIIYEPAGIDIRDYIHCLEGDTLTEELLRPALRFILIALTYLHQSQVIHTDVQPNNILLGIEDKAVLAYMEEDEITNPAPRKLLDDRTIYATRAMPLTNGEPILADLGEARLAEERQTGLIMPDVYRAPEVMLDMEWDNKVDIWAIGQTAWTLFEQGHLFRSQNLDTQSGQARRFAEMVSLLGPPPVEFLRRSKQSLKFWDKEGNWKNMESIPQQSLQSRESRLEGNSQRLFLKFLRKTLCWLPEERPTAEQLLLDQWLRGEDY